VSATSYSQSIVQVVAGRLYRWRTWFGTHWRFVLLALTFAYFFQGSDPNQTSRMLLTKNLVERHAPDITPDAYRTIDKGFHAGKYYSDKAPAVSLLATLPYAAMNIADRVVGIDKGSFAIQRVRLHMLAMVTSGLAGALAAYFLSQTLLLLGSSKKESDLLCIGYALGTLAFPFSTVIFGHQTAACVLIGSFYLLQRMRLGSDLASPKRLASLGLLWGLSIIIEYPTGLLVAVLGIYLLALDPRPSSIVRVICWTGVGAILPLSLHTSFVWWSFGSPFSLPYKYVSDPMFVAHVSAGVLGINSPSKVGVFGVLFSRYRGIFYYCPFLILTLLGFRAWLRQGGFLREAVVCSVMIVVYLFFCTSYYAWDGGGSVGPRHLVPVLPFFVIPIGRYLKEGRVATWLTRFAITVSVAIMGACVAVIVQLPEGDVHGFDPLYEFVVPALLRGEISLNAQDFYFAPGFRSDASYNLGRLLHLSPALSILLPATVWVFAMICPRNVTGVFRAWRQRPSPERTPR
jgi:hypothetical protein